MFYRKVIKVNIY